MKCYYRDRDCDKVDHMSEMGSKPRSFCVCCLMGQIIDLLAKEAEKTTPFLAWGRGEPCPVCGVNPPPNVDANWDAWTAWTLEHLKEHAETEGR